ncbi:hypothetical protein NWO25_12655 [Enterococcus lactis]|nr:hypothetical protein [Enterococcus lactis]
MQRLHGHNFIKIFDAVDFLSSFIQRDIDKRIPKRNNHQLADKRMKRWKIFLSKWIMGILFWSVSYWCCYSITLAYTIYYWDQSIISHPLFISFTYFFWLLALFIDFILFSFSFFQLCGSVG